MIKKIFKAIHKTIDDRLDSIIDDNLNSKPLDFLNYNNVLNSNRTYTKDPLKQRWLYKTGYGIVRTKDVMEFRYFANLSEVCNMCIDRICDEVSNTPWYIIKRDDQDEEFEKIMKGETYDRAIVVDREVKIKNDPIYKEIKYLIENPHPGKTLSNSEFWYGILYDLMVTGNSVISLDFKTTDYDDNGELKPSAKPLAWQALDSTLFNKDIDEYGNTLGYFYFPSTEYSPVSVCKDRIVWGTDSYVPGRHYGVGKIEKAIHRLHLYDLTLKQETEYISQGSMPSGVIIPGERYSKGDIAKLETIWNEELRGKPQATAVLSKPIEFVQFPYTYHDLKYLERTMLYAKLITSIFKLNLTSIGLSAETTNRATSMVDRILARESGIIPYMFKIEDMMNKIIHTFFNDEYYFMFDRTISLDEKYQISQMMVNEYNAGLKMKNEARIQLGTPEVEGGDEFKSDTVDKPPRADLPHEERLDNSIPNMDDANGIGEINPNDKTDEGKTS